MREEGIFVFTRYFLDPKELYFVQMIHIYKAYQREVSKNKLPSRFQSSKQQLPYLKYFLFEYCLHNSFHLFFCSKKKENFKYLYSLLLYPVYRKVNLFICYIL